LHDWADASPPWLDALRRTAKALFDIDEALVLPGGDGALPAGAGPLHPLVAVWHRRPAGTGDNVVVVEDVAGEPPLAAALAGSALPAGFLACAAIGSAADRDAVLFCILGKAPRRFPPDDRHRLADLAALAGAIRASEARAAEATRQAELFRLLADHSTDTLVRGDLDGIRLYISPAVSTLLGYAPEEMIGRRAREIIHPDDAEAFALVMADVRAGRIEQASSEHRQRHKNGHWVWMEAHIRLTRDVATGAPDGYVVSVRDVSHRKAIEARLEHAALHDPLTGLANRTLFRDRLQQEIARSRRTGAHFALFWLDLDRFKAVNDKLGHEAGDVVLRAFAERLKASVRSEDTVARIGGDEFVVLRTPDGTVGGAAPAGEFAARLIGTMDRPVDYAGVPVRIGLSVGVALTQTEGFEADRLLRVADEALYRAKHAGRGRYVVGG
jgi:diguanylate cyclase (GGDEF)-like protein/PAS domain S-box-containing protein